MTHIRGPHNHTGWGSIIQIVPQIPATWLLYRTVGSTGSHHRVSPLTASRGICKKHAPCQLSRSAPAVTLRASCHCTTHRLCRVETR